MHQRKTRPVLHRWTLTNISLRNTLSRIELPRRVNPALWAKAYRYLYEFCELSTLHGLKQLAARGRHWSEYVLWSAVMVAAMGMTVFISSKSWYRYQNDASVIVMDRNSDEWNITFPTGILCPFNKVSPEVLEYMATGYNAKNHTKFMEFFMQLSLSDYETFDLLPDYDEIPASKFLEIIVMATRNFSYTFASTLKKETENMDTVFTELGLCYMYNSKLAPFFKPMALIGREEPDNELGELNYCNTLDGDTFATVTSYFSKFNMTITGPYEMPGFSNPSMGIELTKCYGQERVDDSIARNCTYYDLDIACLPIISTTEVRSLSVEQRGCRTRSDGPLPSSRVYSYNLCRTQCRIDLSLKLCGCMPYFYDFEGTQLKSERTKICDVKGMKCLAKSGSLIADLRHPVTKKKVPCECLPLCTDYHFRVQSVELNKWQEVGVRWQMRNYPKTRYKRTMIFGFSDMSASIGATAGLFTGSSLLSFVELVYFFTLRLAFKIYKKRQKTASRTVLNTSNSKKQFVLSDSEFIN